MSQSGTSTIPRSKAISLYQMMVLIRRFEEQVHRLVVQGKIGSTHSSIGQEAVAAGICGALKKGDKAFTTHRGHSHCLAMGTDVQRFFSELLGRKDGQNRGRAGSMHLVDPENGILGANAIVGGSIPLAVGAAYSEFVKSSGNVIISFFGDGAASEGSCHEAMNLASLWKLPVIFVCEHNGYAEMTASDVHLSVSDLSTRAESYGMPGLSIDGNDLLAVYGAALQSLERARSGNGPSFIFCQTHRMRGHFEGDPEKYRPKGEKESWHLRDPIDNFSKVLRHQFNVDDQELSSIDSEVLAEIEAASKSSVTAEIASGEAILEFVYASE